MSNRWKFSILVVLAMVGMLLLPPITHEATGDTLTIGTAGDDATLTLNGADYSTLTINPGTNVMLLGSNGTSNSPGTLYVDNITGLVFGSENTTITNLTGGNPDQIIYYDSRINGAVCTNNYNFEGYGCLIYQAPVPLDCPWLLMATSFLVLNNLRRRKKQSSN